MSEGSLAKASLVGAKTVKGPGLLSVSTRPPAFTAATRVVWMGELAAFCTMVLVGYISAPPTVGSFWAEALMDVMARAATAIAARNVFFIVVILCLSICCFIEVAFRWSMYLRACPLLQGTHKHLRGYAGSGLV